MFLKVKWLNGYCDIMLNLDKIDYFFESDHLNDGDKEKLVTISISGMSFRLDKPSSSKIMHYFNTGAICEFNDFEKNH